MKISSDLSKLIELGQQYGDRLEYTPTCLSATVDYHADGKPLAINLTVVTAICDGSRRAFYLNTINGCPDLSVMGAYTAALARLTEFTGKLQVAGFRHSKDRV